MNHNQNATPGMIVCEDGRSAHEVWQTTGINAFAWDAALMGRRWDWIICPRRIADSPSETERANRVMFLREILPLKIRPSGRIIWI